jgi:hypothetical protein
MGSKTEELYTDFKFVDANLEKLLQKIYSRKTTQILSIFVFAHFFVVLRL